VPDGTTARTLAPSKEAFDTPLSPPPLGDEPGPATGRSGIYPDGTCTRRSGPVFRTQHAQQLSIELPTTEVMTWQLLLRHAGDLRWSMPAISEIRHCLAVISESRGISIRLLSVRRCLLDQKRQEPPPRRLDAAGVDVAADEAAALHNRRNRRRARAQKWVDD
jgi:hypothetical protein